MLDLNAMQASRDFFRGRLLSQFLRGNIPQLVEAWSKRIAIGSFASSTRSRGVAQSG